ncbi:MAG TPA: 16S rRNA (guanine(527)-N(7))-methyltransferase RsmG [Polyangiaceae bacterium]|nr:16S rRNA (guanine(527)-N(7))-methyltransferase RsmG [Polyangiaceae bacterium]
MALVPLGERWIPLALEATEGLSRQGFHGPERTGAALAGENIARPPARDFAVRLVPYLDEVARWNERTDLTAARSAEELVDLMLADAWVLASRAPAGATRYVDVGSGAGAPGLVVKLLLPDVRMTLVEPRSRRVAFLRTVIGKLGLPSVDVVRARSETLPPASFDVALARATLAPPEWLREGARLSTDVWVLLARETPPEEPGAVVVTDAAYDWPLTGVSRRAVRYTVTRATGR